MIKQFRKLTPVNLFFLVLAALALRVGIFPQMPEVLEFSFAEPSLRLLLPIPSESPFMPKPNVFLAMILTLIQAVLLNRIVNQHNLLGKPSFLPALMYVTASAILMPFMILNPVTLCNFLLIWMIGKFLNIYRRPDIISLMFDMGLITGVGTLIYFPFIAMFLVLLICLIIFRPFNWREWAAGFIGFMLVYLFLAVFYYWNDSLAQFYHIWIPLTTPFPSRLTINVADYIVLVPLILILILSLYQIRQNFFRSYVHIRKSFQLLFALLLLALISFYLKAGEVRIYHFLLAVPPVSIFMAYYFLHARKRWVYETLYFLLAGFIIYFQFF